MTVHRFTHAEMQYLSILSAVTHVTSVRITYSDQFREDATRRYLAGESPVKIFRDAGLDPKLVGYKRIERALARWKHDESYALKHDQTDNCQRDDAVKVADVTVADMAIAELDSFSADDLRDELIAKQVLRIAELEQQRDQLLKQLVEQLGAAC